MGEVVFLIFLNIMPIKCFGIQLIKLYIHFKLDNEFIEPTLLYWMDTKHVSLFVWQKSKLTIADFRWHSAAVVRPQETCNHVTMNFTFLLCRLLLFGILNFNFRYEINNQVSDSVLLIIIVTKVIKYNNLLISVL